MELTVSEFQNILEGFLTVKNAEKVHSQILQQS